MSERSPKDRKSGSPKEIKKSDVGSQKSEENTSAIDTPHSAIKELPTENSSPDSYREQTEKMEVHHHPNLHHERKPWKEYILEGLMIFLAVTMGFFAESLREHLADNERESQYMHAMIADLQKDSVQIYKEIVYVNHDIIELDSLFRCLHSPKLTDSVEVKLYELNMKSGPLVGFEFSDAASEQLKNTGGLRLIRDQEVANAIIHYWAAREEIKLDISVFNQSVQNFWDDGLKIFDMNYDKNLTHPDAKGARFGVDSDARLLTHDRMQLIEYANRAGSLVLALRLHYLKSLLWQKTIEADLERLINKNYKF